MTTYGSKKWQMGDPILVNTLQWGEEEVAKLHEVLESNWFAGNSKFNVELERRLAEIAGVNYVQTVASGSAAILVGVQALIQTGRVSKGDKVLHPALTFATSISGAIMSGLVPVFVDVDGPSLLADLRCIAVALEEHPDIKGIILPALLGNVPDFEKLRKLMGPDRFIFIDSCDTVGSKYLDKELAGYGDLFSYSFYGSHHISTGGQGGAVGTNDRELYEAIKSITFWGRDFPAFTTKANDFMTRYTYSHLGTNVQLPALLAAWGLAQLDRLDEIIELRYKRYVMLQSLFSKYGKYFFLSERQTDKADPSWFAYPVILKPDTPFQRMDFVNYLVEKGVEIRPIFCLYTEQALKVDYKYFQPGGNAEGSEYISDNGFFIPLAIFDDDAWDYYMSILQEFLGKYE